MQKLYRPYYDGHYNRFRRQIDKVDKADNSKHHKWSWNPHLKQRKTPIYPLDINQKNQKKYTIKPLTRIITIDSYLQKKHLFTS